MHQWSPSLAYVQGDGFEGVVFSKEFAFPFISMDSIEKRFTPTKEEIEEAEDLLNKNLKAVNRFKIKQGGENGPVIDTNLGGFVRQYFGYCTKAGDKVVYISCLLRNNYRSTAAGIPTWLKGAVFVLNGGSNYWQVQANLNKASLFGLEVNSIDK
jgi:hypothetical protein